MPIIRQIFRLAKEFPLPPVYERQCAICPEKGAHCHGTYPRYSLGMNHRGKWAWVFVIRFLCLWCNRTFSILPFGYVRRVGKALPCLLGLVSSKTTWDEWLESLGISRNTLAHWKQLGCLFHESIPKIMDTPVTDWPKLSLHLSRLQYPNNLRKARPTIP
ncbi:MAG: hypothetical protein WA705_07605 [Candidatus Ozemobacteraceae bacterium]|jgi:hypothetical protein